MVWMFDSHKAYIVAFSLMRRVPDEGSHKR